MKGLKGPLGAAGEPFQGSPGVADDDVYVQKIPVLVVRSFGGGWGV